MEPAGSAQTRRQVVDDLGLRLAGEHAGGRVRLARAPQRGEVADDAGVRAPVERVVAELALHPVHIPDGAQDRAPAGAVGVDERTVDVKEDEAVHGSGV